MGFSVLFEKESLHIALTVLELRDIPSAGIKCMSHHTRMLSHTAQAGLRTLRNPASAS